MKIPTALVIMGSSMCMVAASMFSIAALSENLFLLGEVAIFIGVGSWIIIQIYNYSRIIAARHRRRELRVKTVSAPAAPQMAPQRQPMMPPAGQQFRRFR